MRFRVQHISAIRCCTACLPIRKLRLGTVTASLSFLTMSERCAATTHHLRALRCQRLVDNQTLDTLQDYEEDEEEAAVDDDDFDGDEEDEEDEDFEQRESAGTLDAPAVRVTLALCTRPADVLKSACVPMS